MESRLHNAEVISRRSQLRNETYRCRCWKWQRTKLNTTKFDHSNHSYFETVNPFHIFAIVYLSTCFSHFITLFSDWNRLTMSLCTTYLVLFVTVCNFLLWHMKWNPIFYCTVFSSWTPIILPLSRLECLGPGLSCKPTLNWPKGLRKSSKPMLTLSWISTILNTSSIQVAIVRCKDC